MPSVVATEEKISEDQKKPITARIIVWAVKAAFAGAVAFGVLNILCMFYRVVPNYVSGAKGMTTSARKPNQRYVSFTEGFGHGRVDKNGYINPPEFAEHDTHDVVIMGSSHMEALQLPQEEITVSLMGAKFGELRLYNVGFTGHNFLTCTKYLQRVIQVEMPKYVVMETMFLNFDSETARLALSEDKPRTSSPDNKPRRRMIQLPKLPYVDLLRFQWHGGHQFRGGTLRDNLWTRADQTLEIMHPEQLAGVIDQIGRTAGENDVRLIIMYHPALAINDDGSATPKTNPDDLRFFADACSEAGITFVDMTDIFLKAYADDHVLPHGFANTRIGTGHLNADGHRMIAEELSRVIREMEHARAAREAGNNNVGDKP